MPGKREATTGRARRGQMLQRISRVLNPDLKPLCEQHRQRIVSPTEAYLTPAYRGS